LLYGCEFPGGERQRAQLKFTRADERSAGRPVSAC
jgi:hypothetical protein